MSTNKTPDITLYFLNASRAIRIAFLMEALNVPYKLVTANRSPNGLAPPDFKAQIRAAGQALGKSPTITDGSLVVTESGSISEYLLETYDTGHKLLPQESSARAKVKEWLYAAEGTFMLHAMAILYARWQLPDTEEVRDGILPGVEEKLAVNVRNDFDWLDSELAAQKDRGSGWLVGEGLTAADIVMQFSIQFIMERKLEEHEAYRRAVQKTGYSLDGEFRK
ncbi:hypothetical protein J7T55_006110 [Diaporthe amygdali]|uniref:uncharacterized protein n=1 Tax=Phomopsis amygdali TaxID=1214568 RepID=UPI0022FF44C6|nr:uncharacterized protein J7T55_006110 [Diaporthe amygdali]KAJ0124769.1 hypothetical protein J7T55_006110 [Diaporthe amygdali]